MINVKAARETSNDGIIDENIWIYRKFNLADAMTKAVIPQEFVEALETNHLH